MAASFKASQASAVEPDQPDSETTLPDEDGSASSTPAEPQDMIEDFDWRDLEERYHDNVNKLNENEQKILAEFSSLCKYFAIWAETSQTHEVDRSYKRLKTQMTLVQHQENELEQKRDHYIKVVDAFKSALQLLGT